jgi:hypothetical protein
MLVHQHVGFSDTMSAENGSLNKTSDASGDAASASMTEVTESKNSTPRAKIKEKEKYYCQQIIK